MSHRAKQLPRLPLLIGTLIVIVLLPLGIYLLRNPLFARADSLLGLNEGTGTTVHDSAGAATGTITNAVWKPESDCHSGKCLFFDGTGDFVSFGDENTYDFVAATNWTMEFWFKTTPISSGTRVMVSKYVATAGYKIYMSSDGKVNFAIDDDATWTPDDIATSTARYDDNTWHHVAVTKTGTSNITLYVDATQVGQDASIAATGTLANANNFYLGIDGDGTSNAFTGYLDDFKIVIASARTAAQIKSDATGGSAVMGTTTEALNQGLVGYWKMDETAANSCGSSNDSCDSSGNGNQGDWGGNTTVSTIAKFGRSTYYDASGDYISMGNKYDFGAADNFTISTWFSRPDPPSNYGAILGKENTLSDPGYVLFAAAGSENYNIGIHLYDDASHDYWVQGGNASVANRWYHATSVINRAAKTATVYLDGIQVATSDISALGSLSNAINFSVGLISQGFGNYYPFYGSVDEVRIYNRALTPSEVQQLYAWAPEPIAYWKMDGPTTETSTQDSSVNNAVTTTHMLDNSSWVGGKLGGAVKLLGSSSQSISAEDSPQLSITKDFTINFWLNPSTIAAATRYPIIAKYQTYSTVSYEVSLYGDEIRTYIGSINNYVTTNAANLVTGTWYHVSTEYNASAQTVKIFLNGVEQATTTTGTIPSSISDETSILNIGKAPSTGGTTSFQVNASGNDGYSKMSGIDGTITSALLSVGNESDPVVTGLRFTNVTVPQGTALSSATLTLTGGDTYNCVSCTLAAEITAEDTDNSAIFTTVNGNISGRSATTSFTSWSLTNIVLNTEYELNVTTAVQEVVDRSGWNSGNALSLLVWDDGSDYAQWQSFYSYDGSTTKAATLDITYGGSDYFNGTLDDIKIYNYVRTQEQIFEDIVGARRDSPLISFDFEEGNGTVAHNLGIGTSNATITNGTWTQSGKFGKAITFGATTSVTTGITDPGYSNSISLWLNPITSIASKTLVTATKLITDASSRPTYGTCVGTALPLSTWTHILAVSESSGSCRIYQNGVQTASNTTGVTFGATVNIGGSSFLGTMDEVKIYNYPLTTSDVLEEYNKGSSVTLGAVADSPYCPPGTTCTAPAVNFKFDENTGTIAYDTGGTGLQGTLTNSPTWGPGKMGPAVVGNGSNSYVDINDNYTLDLGTTAYSFFSWINISKTAVDDIIVMKGGGGTGDIGFILQPDTSNTGHLLFGISNGSSYIVDELPGTTDVCDSQWHYVGFTWDPAVGAKIYVDGRLENSAAVTSAVNFNSSEHMYIGGYSSSTFSVNGKIDDVRIYKYARTPAQIAWDFNKGAPVAQYDFDECADSILHNVISTSLNGTIIPNAGRTTGTCGSGTSTEMWNGGTAGKFSSSLFFDGAGDYVQVADSTNLNLTGSFSLSTWVKLQSLPQYTCILERGSDINSRYYIWLQYEDILFGVNNDFIAYDANLSTGTWAHIAVVHDSESDIDYVYKDGQLITSQPGRTTDPATTGVLRIGQPTNATYQGAYFTNGQLDDVRIYNYALTETQIKSVMNHGSVSFSP